MSQEAVQPQNTQWYILRGELKYGPYDYKAMLTMIQEGKLFDFNYVWAPHLENWCMVGDIQDFSKDRLCRLIDSNDEIARSFKDRKAPRADVRVKLYAHNEHNFFDGESLSVSENGALVLLNDPLLQIGQKIVVHFRGADNNPEGFNALCEIVRKNFTKQRLNVKSGLHYAVRFLHVQESGMKQLSKWTRSGASKEEANGRIS